MAAKEFITLLLANSEEDVRKAVEVAKVLVVHGCVEFCCLGEFASEMKDALDLWLESVGMINVVTTAFVDRIEAFEYFVFAAGAGEKLLVALSDEGSLLANELMEFARGRAMEARSVLMGAWPVCTSKITA